MSDIRCGCEFVCEECLELFPVLGDDFENEVGLTNEHVAFADFGPLLDIFFEFFEVTFGLR